ncbi:MAG TPA: hypothetical protein VNZ26_22780, partial [Vicinamibacterales bacterium]|nr:hypothetical protein [Vicinamibacterales bacterium]
MHAMRTLRAFATAAALALILTVFGFPAGLRVQGQSDTTKLSTVLAELAQSVPQDQPGVNAAQSTASTRPLAIESLPKSVQDAVRGRHMRLNERNEVQVSILVTEVNDENTRTLSGAGVTLEISDAQRRRLQARIPASRLQAVAALPFVTFIRLPTYARRHTGSVTSEGDLILQAAAARKQFSVDGTGVRVGVISDGLKGIFATNCANCGGVGGGPISTGDLPDSTGTRNSAGVLKSSSGGINGQTFPSSGDLEGLPTTACGFAGAGAEGTALLEIVHDLAPGAQLSFANGDTDAAFEQAVNALRHRMTSCSMTLVFS